MRNKRQTNVDGVEKSSILQIQKLSIFWRSRFVSHRRQKIPICKVIKQQEAHETWQQQWKSCLNIFSWITTKEKRDQFKYQELLKIVTHRMRSEALLGSGEWLMRQNPKSFFFVINDWRRSSMEWGRIDNGKHRRSTHNGCGEREQSLPLSLHP